MSAGPISGNARNKVFRPPHPDIYCMNDLYNETIERRGKIYHYDPDMDIYYVRYASHSFWDNYAWIVVVILLAIVCYCLEYRPGLV